MVFSPDGSRLASVDQGHWLRLWETATGRAILVAGRQRGNSGDALGFSPDGRWLASGGDDGVVRLWDAQTGAPFAACRGHARPIGTLAFSPDGRRLVSTADTWDEPSRLWDAATGHSLAALSPARISRLHAGRQPRHRLLSIDAIHVMEAASGKVAMARTTSAGRHSAWP